MTFCYAERMDTLPPLPELETEFRETYLPSRNLAPLTRTTYSQLVATFVVWLAEHGITSPAKVELRNLNAFLAHLDNRGLAGSTRRKYVYALKLFFQFLEDHQHVSQNVALRLIPPATESKQPRVLTTTEYTRLRDVVRYQTRDAAIVELLLQTGIRLGEIARIKLDDLYVPKKISAAADNAGSLTVRQGKGRKDRTVTLNHRACEALIAYLKVRPADTPYQEVFLTKHRRPMQPRAYQMMLERSFARAGIERAHPHTLRHTFGTHMVKSGANLRSVQEMMGHSDLKTTSRYIALAREQMDKDMQTHAL